MPKLIIFMQRRVDPLPWSGARLIQPFLGLQSPPLDLWSLLDLDLNDEGEEVTYISELTTPSNTRVKQ